MSDAVDAARPVPGGPVHRVLSGQRLPVPPIWLMRQAGRYLPEYRQTRSQAGSFLDLCFAPKLAAEVTLQPIRRFDFDAAILFSDILVVPFALGRRVAFVEGEGPVLDPIAAGEIAALDPAKVMERLAPVLETVDRVRSDLSREKTLIGFCGAPFTVATYMVAGHGTRDQEPARLMAYRDPASFGRLIDVLAEASADYLIAQARAGADVLQIFDSWAGVLPEAEFTRWSTEPTARIVAKVRAAVPGVRIIGFARGAGIRLGAYAEATGVDAVGVDWTLPLAYIRDSLQPMVAVQGNLDPLALLAGGPQLDEAVSRILAGLSSGCFVFNLGHGILPQTPLEHVTRLVQLVRGQAA